MQTSIIDNPGTLVGPSGQLISSRDITDVITPDMQEFTDDTQFDVGSLVEIRYRSKDGSPRKKGCDTRIGYILEDDNYKGSIILTKDIPKRHLNQKEISRNQISEFRIFPSTGEYMNGFKLIENVRIGTIIEMIMKTKNPLEIVKHAGYVNSVSAGGFREENIRISMEHPSNRYSSSSNQRIYRYVDKFRVLGHRKLW